jgi:hypothetical protein
LGIGECNLRDFTQLPARIRAMNPLQSAHISSFHTGVGGRKWRRHEQCWADTCMMTGRMLGIVLALIGLIVFALSVVVIHFSTSPR